MRTHAAVVDGLEVVRREKRQRLFYRWVLPVLIGLNLALGCFLLALLLPRTWLGWAELATGAFCCTLAGWLIGAWWSRQFWRNSVSSQLVTWHRVIDELFVWIEELPVAADDLKRLRRSVNRIISTQ